MDMGPMGMDTGRVGMGTGAHGHREGDGGHGYGAIRPGNGTYGPDGKADVQDLGIVGMASALVACTWSWKAWIWRKRPLGLR